MLLSFELLCFVIQAILKNEMLLDNLATDQMLLNNLFQHSRIATAVPCSFGINQSDRPAGADAQAVGFRSEDATLLAEAEFLQSPFEIVPGDQRTLVVATLRLGLIAAEKNMPLRGIDTHRAGKLLQGFWIWSFLVRHNVPSVAQSRNK